MNWLPGKEGRREDSRGRELARSKDADTDFNIYYCAVDPELGKQILQKQQRDGVDANSRAVDPMFVDPENGRLPIQAGISRVGNGHRPDRPVPDRIAQHRR